MDFNELQRNSRELCRMCLNDLGAPFRLEISDAEVMWDKLCLELMDWLEEKDAKGEIHLEKVEAEEIKCGFQFRATSKDGTTWEGPVVDCHKFAPGSTVGRFPDSEGRLVIVRRKA